MEGQGDASFAPLLLAGRATIGEKPYWYYLKLYEHLDVVREAARSIEAEVRQQGPDLLCALRGSGLVLASALALSLRIKLSWFVEPAPDKLFPGVYQMALRAKGGAVMMIDSHSVTGGTVFRHGVLLKECLGARLCRPFVFIDCDTYTDPGCRDWFGQQFDSLSSLTSLSRLVGEQGTPAPASPDLESFLADCKAGGMSFWQPPGVNNSESLQAPDNEGAQQDVRDPPSIPLLDDRLAKDCHSLTRIRVRFLGKHKGMDPWLLYNSPLLDRVFEKAEAWFGPAKYSTVVAASYWGLPFALLIAHHIEANEVFCLDGEVIPVPQQGALNGKNVLLVDDAIKKGHDITRAFKLLQRAGALCSRCLMVIDNNTFPDAHCGLHPPEAVELRAVTRTDI